MNPSPVLPIQEKIFVIRDTEVMLDSDLASLYGIETRHINQAVSRNIERFPDDFMFECSEAEWEILRSQNVTLASSGRGKHRKYVPKVFTEQGVYMPEEMILEVKGVDSWLTPKTILKSGKVVS